MANNLALKDASTPASFEDWKALSDADRRKAMGQNEERLGNNLQRLKINYEAEYVDDKVPGFEPIQLTRGVWTIPVKDEEIDRFVPVYAKTASFRPYLRTYQYAIYNKDEKARTLTSSLFKTWGEVVIDDMGNEYRAAKYKKSLIKARPDLEKGLQCQQIIYGTVTLPGAKDMRGVERAVTDTPCRWVSKGSSFMPVSEAIDAITAAGKDMYTTTMVVNTKREKSDDVTFFIPIVTFGPDSVFGKSDWDLLKNFQDTIKAENNQILDAFRKKSTRKSSDLIAAKVVDGGDLAKDFGDEVGDL
jgi:hypothetical protein